MSSPRLWPGLPTGPRVPTAGPRLLPGDLRSGPWRGQETPPQRGDGVRATVDDTGVSFRVPNVPVYAETSASSRRSGASVIPARGCVHAQLALVSPGN